MESSSSSFKEVLVIFGDRRRPIQFKRSEDPAIEYSNVVSAVQVAFKDVAEDGSSMYMQRLSKVWGYIDLTATDKIEHQSQLYLHFAKPTAKEKVCKEYSEG